MHSVGAPQGCHDGATALTGTVDAMAGGHTMSVAAGVAATGIAVAHAAPAAPGSERGHGQVCVSTPPRPTPAAVAITLLLLTALSATPIPGRSAPRPPTARRRRRAPPPHGSALLVCFCVSRT
jgi:hypothetical protein